MKKTFSVIIAMLLVLSITFAQGIEPEVEAGITPDSPFYGIDVWWDNMRVNMAQKIEEKARLRLEIAEERASEMEVMGMANKFTYMERARNEERKQVEEIEKLQLEMNDDEKVNIQQKLRKHIKVLEGILEKVPEQAKKGIQTAIESSSKVFERNQEQISKEKRESVQDIEEKISGGEIEIKSSSVSQQNRGNR